MPNFPQGSDKGGFLEVVGVGLQAEVWRDGRRFAFSKLKFS